VRDALDLRRFFGPFHVMGIDVLVVSAGVGAYGSATDATRTREMVDTNVLGFINTIQAALPYLLNSGQADLVGVTSTAGLSITGNSSVYTATKHAQVAYLEAIDAELGSPEFRVTNIAPGNVATNFAMGAGRTEGMPQLDDMLRPEDVAREIVRSIELPRDQRADTVVIRPTRRFRAT
jgi:3-oxoacyl-[acyl-carrier protein] reductase